MGANPASYDQDGIIYFTVDSGGAFILTPGSGVLDGTDFDLLKGNNLTLQGGWNGASGNTSFTQTNFGTNPVQIGTDANPWVGNIIIKDITITGVSTTGLTVISAGGITLDSVNSSGNDGDGAYLDNSYGSGSINITSTAGPNTFNGNASDGIEVYSNGNISLSGVTANGNAAASASA